jgi:hypothetical protein
MPIVVVVVVAGEWLREFLVDALRGLVALAACGCSGFRSLCVAALGAFFLMTMFSFFRPLLPQ